MANCDNLRSQNKKLLERLKKSQVDISQLIIASKHSDPRYMSTAPLTSTKLNKNGRDALKESGKLLSQVRQVLSKSPGILKKRKQTPKKTKLPTPNMDDTTPTRDKENKYEILSDFLKKQTDKGKHLTFCEEPSDQPMLTDPGNERPLRSKSILMKTTEPDQATEAITPTRNRPLLGYDWITGMMDVGTPKQHSDSFLEEMNNFRKLNRSECQSNRLWSEATPTLPISPVTKIKKYEIASPDPRDIMDPRIINYTINKRLFPVPVDPNDAPTNQTSPRYIRVSIPKSSLASPYRYRTRRTPLDGADSLSLPDHCSLGFSSKNIPRKSLKLQDEAGLDLRASLHPQESLAVLQLKSGQTNLPGGIRTTNQPHESFLDMSHSFQYRLKNSRKNLK